MARLKKGLLAGFSGKIGPVVGSSWKGIEYIRSKGIRKRDTHPNVLARHRKMGLIQGFFRSLGPLAAIGFKDFAIGKTGTNCAVGYNLRHAIAGTIPQLYIDYSLLMISRGGLPGVNDVSVSATPGNELLYTWATELMGIATGTDKCMALAYCPDLDIRIWSTAGNNRDTGSFTLDTSYFVGRTAETWLAFVSADGKNVSDSIYTGRLML